MMTSKSDPKGHPGLKLCVDVSVMGYYRFINFIKIEGGRGFSWATSRGMTLKTVASGSESMVSHLGRFWFISALTIILAIFVAVKSSIFRVSNLRGVITSTF